MNKMMKAMLLVFMILYVVSPDVCPGPIDDVIVIFLSMMAQKHIGTVKE